MKLVLFDTYGVLIRQRSGSRYMAEAMLSIYGVEIDGADTAYADGMTARQSATATLLAHGIEREVIEARMQHFLDELQYAYQNDVGLEKLVDAGKLLIDGARELLSRLEASGAMLGIATGSPEGIAAFDLNRAGISHHFKACAYGGAETSMRDVIAHAMRIASELGFEGGAAATCVVAASPAVIDAAISAGARAVAVVPDNNSPQEQGKARAGVVAIRNLRHAALLKTILG